MKPSALDTEPATLDGTLADAGRGTAPAVWKLRLIYAAGQGIVQAPPLTWETERPLEVGRRSSGPAPGGGISIQDERVSRQHARLYRSQNTLVVEDLHSRNGSALNGVRLMPGVAQPLLDGDVLRVGDSFLVIRYEPELIADSPVASYVGVSRAAIQVRCAIARCALHRRAVLILGETGTGKEVTAQALHQLSRRPGRLVAINCAAIPETLAEAQLFGVARGAFTGAVERLGAFGEADGGTLFLDELGELPGEIQAKLLRTLETGEVMPVGGRHPIARDVRVLAATNRDLHEALRGKTFRADLYARLTAEIIRLPPLRERREDTLVLAQRFAGPAFQPTPRLVAALLAHSWPLNARQVGHAMAQLQDRSEEEVIAVLARDADGHAAEEARGSASARDLRDPRATVDAVPSPPAGHSGEGGAPPRRSDGAAVPRWKSGDKVPGREQVVSMLQQHHGNLSHIEAHSGYSRRQFRRWVEGYGLDLAAFRTGPAES